MKKEAIAHGVWEDLANRNDNWDKLDGIPEKVTELQESRLTLKNLIENGDFSDGTKGWAANLSTLKSVNNTLEMTAEEERAYVGAYININTTIGDVYYLSAEMKSTFATTFRIGVGGAAPIDNSQEWNKATQIRTADSNRTPLTFYSNLKVSETSYLRNPIYLNLTQIFGEGNEPTKEQMDEIINITGWFDNEYAVSNKEMFIALLNMVRENALATTSLGGGF